MLKVLYLNEKFNGSLRINGNLKLTNSSVINNRQAAFNVNGKVTASDTEFVASTNNLKNVTSDGFYIMGASKGFVNSVDPKKSFTDVSSRNTAEIVFNNELVNVSSNLYNSKLAGNTGTLTSKDFDTIAPETDLGALYKAELVQKGNSLYVNGGFAQKTTDGKRTDFTQLNNAIKAEFVKQKAQFQALANGDKGLFVTNKKNVDDQITQFTQKGGTIATAEAEVKTKQQALNAAKKTTWVLNKRKKLTMLL